MRYYVRYYVSENAVITTSLSYWRNYKVFNHSWIVEGKVLKMGQEVQKERYKKKQAETVKPLERRKGRGGSGVYKDKRTNSWAFRVKTKEKDVKKTGFKSEKQALKERIKYIEEQEKVQAEKERIKGKDLKFEELVEVYFEEGTVGKAPKTITKHESVFRNHLIPKFQGFRVRSMTAGDFNLYFEEVYFKGENGVMYAFSYIQGWLRAIYALFGFAYKGGYIDRTQYDELLIDEKTRINMPEMTQADVLEQLKGARIFNSEEIEKMRSRIKKSPLRLAFELGLNCGLRLSEVFGLRWSDVNLRKEEYTVRKENGEEEVRTKYGSININKQLHNIKDTPFWAYVPVKTLTAVRTVYINKKLYELLLEVKEETERNRIKYGNLYHSENIIFDYTDERRIGENIQLKVNDCLLVNEKGDFFNTNSFKRWVQVFESELKIEFNFHWLRHTFCSELAGKGCPVSELLKVSGHKKVETALKYYINTTETAQQKLLESIETL